MPISVGGFVVGRVMAQQQGIVDPNALNRLSILGGMLGFSAPGILITRELARREAASAAAAAAPASVTVPDVVKQPLATAQARLSVLGLQVQSQNVTTSDIPKGQVTSQNPVAGSTVPQGTSVMLSVSQGFPVPDVTTKVYAEADKLLRALGLIPQRLDESSTAPRDTVFKQDPAPPQFVAGGETVKLSVSKGT